MIHEALFGGIINFVLLFQVVIAGNHDLPFDTESYPNIWRRFGHPRQFECEEVKDKLRKAPGVTYLEDSGTTINGINIWGSPWLVQWVWFAVGVRKGCLL